MKENWEYKKLGEVANFFRGLTYSKNDEAENSNVRVLRSNNIDLNTMSLTFDEMKFLKSDFIIPQSKKLKGNSIFICMSNGSKQHIGKVAYIDHDMDFAFGGFMGLIVPKKEILSKYVYYICRSSIYRKFLISVGNGIGITNLKFTDLDNFSFPVCSFVRQQEIVSELDLLSGVIEKEKKQLEELDLLAQSIFYDMFGDPVTNEKGWEVKKLADIATSKIGLTYKPENVSENGTIVLRSSNIQGNVIALDDIVRVDCSIKDNQWVKDGDILMCSRNGSFKLVGKVAMIKNLPEQMTYGAFMTVIRSQYNAYLFAFFKSPAFRAQLGCAGTATINQITVKMLNDISLPLPPLSLQQSFAAKVEAIEALKAKVRQSLTEAETLFNSRMDYYFN